MRPVLQVAVHEHDGVARPVASHRSAAKVIEGDEGLREQDPQRLPDELSERRAGGAWRDVRPHQHERDQQVKERPQRGRRGDTTGHVREEAKMRIHARPYASAPFSVRNERVRAEPALPRGRERLEETDSRYTRSPRDVRAKGGSFQWVHSGIGG